MHFSRISFLLLISIFSCKACIEAKTRSGAPVDPGKDGGSGNVLIKLLKLPLNLLLGIFKQLTSVVSFRSYDENDDYRALYPPPVVHYRKRFEDDVPDSRDYLEFSNT